MEPLAAAGLLVFRGGGVSSPRSQLAHFLHGVLISSRTLAAPLLVLIQEEFPQILSGADSRRCLVAPLQPECLSDSALNPKNQT